MKRMSKKHKIMALILIIILGSYAYEYVPTIFSSTGSVENLEKKLKNLRFEKKAKLDKAAEEAAKKDTLKLNSEYFWKTTGVTPNLTIQNAIKRAASSAKVKFRSTGTARDSEVTKNIKKVQMSVSLMCSMREASALFREIDEMKPTVFWESCSIRPDSRDQNKVYISGQLTTYVLTKKATKLLNPGKGGKK